jgi:pyruvate-formate lyase
LASFLLSLNTSYAVADHSTVSSVNTNRFLTDPNAYVAQLKLFTDVYKKYSAESTAAREVECLKVQYPIYFCDIQDGDLFVGRNKQPIIGFMPQSAAAFGYYIQPNRLNEILENPKTSKDSKRTLTELAIFWKTENSNQQCRNAFPPKMKEVLNSEGWQTESVIASPLYRMSGTQGDFDKLILLGIPGLRAEILKYKGKVAKNSNSYQVYDGMEKALDLFCEIAEYYADMAKMQAENSTGSQKAEYLEMEKVLRKNTISKPETFREALQLMFLYANITGTINYGRMDEYMGDLYAKGIDSKSLTEDEAIDMLVNLWKMIDDKKNIWDSRIFVGGKGRRNEANADRFALAAIEATKRAHCVAPQFSLRFYNDQNPALYEKGLDVIASGIPYPMIYNDEVNIPSVMNAFKVSYEEAVNYLPFGCGEYILYHRSVGTPSGVINLLQALSVTLNKGINPLTKKPMGLPTSELGSFDTFDGLYSAYKKNVELYVEQLAYQEKLEYDFAAKSAPYLFLSMIFDDCIKRGKGIFDGGVRYLGGTLESYGNTNTANSLAAIKKLVYDEKKFTLDEIRTMLNANFVGFEKEKRMLLDAPKYGNDNQYADDMKVEVDRHICTVTRNMSEKAGLDSYLIVIINNSANTTMGLQTAATPDGRNSRIFMANGNNPTGGTDKNGVTSFLNSLVKPDTKIHAGAVQNMKFSKEMMTTYRDKIEILLKTYWEKGGAQCMITCIGRGDLEQAMIHPEQYANLIVRVGGFSAKFVELPKDVQLEILSRTIY